jgi:hypothetical protein
MNVEAVLDTGYFSPPDDLENYSCIICTPGLERTLSSWNFSEKTKIQDLSNGNAHFDIVYSSGQTFIAMNTRTYGR